jgi:hypothetical protein
MKLTRMYKFSVIVIGFLLFLLVGCRQGELLTPTPFPPTPENMSLGPGGSSITPVPAVLADVAANPEFYEGAYLQVTGQYFRKPLQVCGIDPHPSPAGWELAAGDTRMSAGGFNNQLRELMPDGITMTVLGRFSHWQGPVGCGKQAVPKEMWYLDVVKIVDPAQLARVTLTPANGNDLISEGEITDDLFTPIGESDERPPIDEALLPTSPPVAPPTNTAVPTRAVPVETLGAGFTPVATNDIGITTPTISGTADGTKTAETPGTPQTTPGTSTVTNTPPPGATLTPTPSGGSTPIPTASGGSSVKVISDPLLTFDFKMVDLDLSVIHEWTMSLDTDEEVVVAVIGEPTMDMVLKLFDKNLTELASADSTSTGQMESISFKPNAPDEFKVRVSEKSGASGGYLLALGIKDFLFLYPQGMLTYGNGDSATITWEELHYWFFEGSEDDVIDLAISCNVGSDPTVYLYDPSGEKIAEQFYQGDMEDITLPETGWYVFEIEFWTQDGEDCPYSLIVTN